MWKSSEPTGVSQFCVSSGACCPGTAVGLCFWSVPTATHRAVTSTAGNGTAFRDGQTESGKSVGDAGLVLDCATLPKAAICVRESCFERLETHLAPICGFLTCSSLSMLRQNSSGAVSPCAFCWLPVWEFYFINPVKPRQNALKCSCRSPEGESDKNEFDAKSSSSCIAQSGAHDRSGPANHLS